MHIFNQLGMVEVLGGWTLCSKEKKNMEPEISYLKVRVEKTEKIHPAGSELFTMLFFNVNTMIVGYVFLSTSSKVEIARMNALKKLFLLISLFGKTN